jgi:hypothetical protein
LNGKGGATASGPPAGRQSSSEAPLRRLREAAGLSEALKPSQRSRRFSKRRGLSEALKLSERFLGDFPKLLGLSEALKLLQRLVLDLADPLAGDVEGAADLVKCSRVLPAQAIAQL